MPEPVRLQILSKASFLTSKDRAQTYGDSDVNMTAYGELLEWWAKWGETLDPKSAAHTAGIIMVLAKLSRIAVGRFHDDNYIDAAAYLAIACQAEHSARNPPSG